MVSDEELVICYAHETFTYKGEEAKAIRLAMERVRDETQLVFRNEREKQMAQEIKELKSAPVYVCVLGGVEGCSNPIMATTDKAKAIDWAKKKLKNRCFDQREVYELKNGKEVRDYYLDEHRVYPARQL